MLDTIREFFERHIGGDAPQEDDRHALQLATAALLVEVARIDGEIQPAERDAVLRAVRGKFALSDDEAETLFRLAEEEARQATGYYQFTSLINRQFTIEQKTRVIELLWEAAYADADLTAHEQHVMRKIADLLYIPHAAYIAAKMRARDMQAPTGG